ncbi:MAG TPA: uroporphyrinogen-III synthase, partial [Acidimicrobiales bacterium]|nr:uroporphyrinogen-III synthase [Acidimicrobiales bacterium]
AASAELVELPVYRWNLPEDVTAARHLIDASLRGEVHALTFTSQPAVRHLFRIAEETGQADDLRTALNGSLLAACVGPVCAEAAKEEGVEHPLWPEPPRLPAMVRQITEHLQAG